VAPVETGKPRLSHDLRWTLVDGAWPMPGYPSTDGRRYATMPRNFAHLRLARHGAAVGEIQAQTDPNLHNEVRL